MADNGTSVDIAPVENASEEVAKDFKLDPYLLDMLWNEPFYASIMRSVEKIKTDSIPTAGVAAIDGKLKMWWNPAFVASLAPEKVRGLLKHEARHIILGHIASRRKEPHLQWNYATDWSINCEIPDNELPEMGLKPGKAYTPLTEEQLEGMSDQQIQDYQTLSSFQEKLPSHMSAEWYFTELMNNEEANEALTRSKESGGGMPGDMDDHGGWDEMSDDEREYVKGKVKEAIKDAVKKADNNGARGWGSISSEARKRIRSIISNEVQWQQVLKKFCGFSRRSTRTRSWTRLNKKYMGAAPGVKRGYTSSIAVYIDQSGSVDDKSLEQLFAELANLSKRTEFVCYHFDTAVDEKSETVWKKGRMPDVFRTRCGGTDFKAPTKHANENKHRFDGYLILTDGEAPDPGPSRLKRGWVVIPGRELMFDPSKSDFVIQMNNKVAA